VDAKLEAVKKFEFVKKMGGTEISRPFFKELVLELDQMLAGYYQNNEMKKCSRSIKTPLTLFTLMIFNYMLACFFSMIWMDFIAFMFMFGFYICLLVVLFWLFSRYKNDFRELSQCVDFVASFIWDNVNL
jgi:hypothetical protein